MSNPEYQPTGYDPNKSKSSSVDSSFSEFSESSNEGSPSVKSPTPKEKSASPAISEAFSDFSQSFNEDSPSKKPPKEKSASPAISEAFSEFSQSSNEKSPTPESTPKPVVEKSPTPEPVVEKSPTPEPVVEKSPTPEPVVEKSPTPEPVAEPSKEFSDFSHDSPSLAIVSKKSPKKSPKKTKKRIKFKSKLKTKKKSKKNSSSRERQIQALRKQLTALEELEEIEKKEEKEKKKKKTKLRKKIKLNLPKQKKSVVTDDIIPLVGKKCPPGYNRNKEGNCQKKKTKFKKTCDEMIGELEGIVDKLTIEEEKYNNILKCFSERNKKFSGEKFDFLYPILDDENFNKKISTKKEFYDTRYIERPSEDYENIEEITNKLCQDREFELSPHQKFVRNFLSYKTPYNSLLLYHGLGSGKTCSAISVCEQARLYSKQLKNTKRIIIVASPNVQENFKLQLFDERKLKNVDGNWNIKSCTGNSFIKEINPMNMRGLSRDKVIRQIKRIINNSYLFLGYLQFANWISKIIKNHLRDDLKHDEKRIRSLKYIQKEFSNRMIVIDEVQNIRNTEEGTDKKTSENLTKLVKYTEDMKLLLLSATPMFNIPEEIVWLLNLMNINDDRYYIKERDIFDGNGNLRRGKNGEEIGKELLIQKSTGYISFVRGENPFTFPFRLFPNDFKNPHSLKKIIRDNPNWYPNKQINNTPIIEPINILDLYICKLGLYQESVYDFAVEVVKNKYPVLKNPQKGIQYTVLDPLIQTINFAYPTTNKRDSWSNTNFKSMYGKKGLQSCMFNKVDKTTKKRTITYRESTLGNFGRIFSPEELPKYSGKISKFCNIVKKSKGIILIYSQFIDGGCVPIALALEEMGFKRYGKRNSLFKTNDVEPLNALTMQPHEGEERFHQASYIMITGDPVLSPDNNLELIACTNENNTNGEIVKVIIVSKAGSEGLDFKNIRQVHILEPWYNLNRIEQTIGRAVRNLSHCLLPFIERNVEIYLHGTELENNTSEAVDLYMYRLAELKAKKIGIISRIIKENAIDCLLNKSYNKIDIDKVIQLSTSSDQKINFNIKDKVNSSLCDYMDNCDCNCVPDDIDIQDEDVKQDTYDETFIMMNIDKILYRIKMLFKEKYIYDKDELIVSINARKFYPKEQIYMALTQLIEDDNEFITDMLGRLGKLIIIGDFYMFQPIEIDNKNISLFERQVPIDYKRKRLVFNLPEEFDMSDGEEDNPEDVEERRSLEMEKSAEKFRPPETKRSIIQNPYDKLYQDLEKNFLIIQSPPQTINATTRNLWSYNCAWTIYNLNKFNTELERTLLLKMAFFHFLDKLSYKEKVIVINNIYFKDSPSLLEKLIKEYFEYFMINDNTICLYNSKKKKPIVFLFKEEGEWKENKMKTSLDIVKEVEKKFKFVEKTGEKSFTIGNLNSMVGFMIHDPRYNIIYKTKELKMSSNKRIKKGISCKRGQTKGVLINIINQMIENKEGNVKYNFGHVSGSKRNNINGIYSFSGVDILMYEYDADGKRMIHKTKSTNISTLQLCIEIELLFRYYNYTKKDNKIWFLSELESNINKIEMVGI